MADLNLPDALQTRTHGPSSSTTVAKGSINELAARDPVLAAKLAASGTQLRSAGVSGSTHFSATATLSTPSVPDARTAEQVLKQVDQILTHSDITQERALNELQRLFGGLPHELQEEIADVLNKRFDKAFLPEERRGMSAG